MSWAFEGLLGQMTNPKFLIYGLVDPRTDKVRYVGKSTRGLGRARDHGYPWYVKRNAHLPIAKWVRELKAIGLRYKVLTLEEVSSAGELPEAEIRNIAKWRGIMGNDLLNLSNGGTGGRLGLPHSEETKRKISLAQKGRKQPRHVIEAAAKARRGNHYRLGISHTRQSRLKMSRSCGGRPFQDQFGNRYELLKDAENALGVSTGDVCAILHHNEQMTTKGVCDLNHDHRMWSHGYTFAYLKGGGIPSPIPVSEPSVAKPPTDGEPQGIPGQEIHPSLDHA